MATPVDPEYRARLQALAERYALTVPVTMDRIAQALAACRTAAGAGTAPPAACVAQLHELLHGVAGSAGTFGFGTLGQYCRSIEQRARGLLATLAEGQGRQDAGVDVPAANGAWPALAAEVERLLAWAARDPRAPSW